MLSRNLPGNLWTSLTGGMKRIRQVISSRLAAKQSSLCLQKFIHTSDVEDYKQKKMPN